MLVERGLLGGGLLGDGDGGTVAEVGACVG